MATTPPTSEDGDSALRDKFLNQVSAIFKSRDKIDFPDSQLHVTTEGRCILTWDTPQDDSCPGHILECDDTNPDYIVVTSSQYAKCIPPRKSNKPRAVCFRIPTKTLCGMRELVYDTMLDLWMDPTLRKKAEIRTVSMMENTPRRAVWHLERAKSVKPELLSNSNSGVY